eukprot:TRINITY_DN10773_c0_g4_i1.p1 TRINITY_DN10773_c0_g4~~TRINITY_DN10773_c0_g4_i1.p1  ORF type:complete len:223 (+),score=60.95 TRINITY_DN10773_c0_g4_i1:47-670(+)
MSEQEEPKERMKRLMKERDEMESELKENIDELMKTPAGLTGPLKDEDGYPRADCDLHVVTKRRGRVACLRNDLKVVMESIKNCIEDVHSASADGPTPGAEAKDEETAGEDPLVTRFKEYPEFLTVGSVLPDSPAASGLRQGDKILSWNGITKNQTGFLQMISKMTLRYENNEMNIVVKRGALSVQKVVITPKKWSGKGLLGCVLNKI